MSDESSDIITEKDLPVAFTAYPVGEKWYPEFFYDFPYHGDPKSEVVRVETSGPEYRARYFDLARPFNIPQEAMEFTERHLVSHLGMPRLKK